MFIRNRLLCAVSLASSAFFLDANTGGAGGGNGGQPPQSQVVDPPTPAPTPAPQPEGETVEARLQSAGGIIARLHSQVGSLTTERDNALAEQRRLEGQFNQATQTAERLQGELNTRTSERDTAISERDTARTQLQSANANVSRLERLQGLGGSTSVVTAPENNGNPGAPAADPLAALQEQYKNEKDPEKKAGIAAQMTALRDAKKS